MIPTRDAFLKYPFIFVTQKGCDQPWNSTKTAVPPDLSPNDIEMWNPSDANDHQKRKNSIFSRRFLLKPSLASGTSISGVFGIPTFSIYMFRCFFRKQGHGGYRKLPGFGCKLKSPSRCTRNNSNLRLGNLIPLGFSHDIGGNCGSQPCWDTPVSNPHGSIGNTSSKGRLFIAIFVCHRVFKVLFCLFNCLIKQTQIHSSP